MSERKTATGLAAEKDAEILEQCRLNAMGAEREDRLRAQVAERDRRITELEAENFRLAAGQCPDGFGDEGGTPHCCAEARIRELEAALAAQDEPVAEVIVCFTRASGAWGRVENERIARWLTERPPAGTKLYAGRPPAAEHVDVDALAQFIRAVDGNNKMGAGALAERIVEWLELPNETEPAAEQAEVPQNPYPSGSIREGWQRGFEGRPMLAYPGSDYARTYAEGKAARAAMAAKVKP